jgi:hypothetical protein
MNYKHGLRNHPLYSTWKSMKARCYNQRSTNYERYGARGVTVCDEWRNDFAAFLRDMGEKPSPKHSLERKNNAGPYSPDNCCWATASEQVKNRRAYVMPNKQGEKHPMAKLSDEDAEMIRALGDVLKRREIAKMFSISVTTVGDIIKGRRRTHPANAR